MNRNKKTVTSCLLVLCLLLLIHKPIFAQKSMIPNLLKESVEIQFNIHYKESETEVVPIQGVHLELYKVANVRVESGQVFFEVLPEFKDYLTSKQLSGLKARESLELSSLLFDEIIKQKIKPLDSKISNEKGEMVFDNLDEGIYLVAQIEQFGLAKEYNKLQPFLLNAPRLITNKDGVQYWQYKIKATPKTALIKHEEPKTPPTTVDTPKKPPTLSPKTGDSSNVGFYLALIILIISLIIILNRKEKELKKVNKTEFYEK